FGVSNARAIASFDAKTVDIVFGNQLAGVDIDAVTVNANEVQRITLTSGANGPATGGSFTLSVTPPGGSAIITAAIAPVPGNAAQTATNIQNALTAAGVLGAGNASVTAASAT